jgi:hypothetical protein
VGFLVASLSTHGCGTPEPCGTAAPAVIPPQVEIEDTAEGGCATSNHTYLAIPRRTRAGPEVARRRPPVASAASAAASRREDERKPGLRRRPVRGGRAAAGQMAVLICQTSSLRCYDDVIVVQILCPARLSQIWVVAGDRSEGKARGHLNEDAGLPAIAVVRKSSKVTEASEIV